MTEITIKSAAFHLHSDSYYASAYQTDWQMTDKSWTAETWRWSCFLVSHFVCYVKLKQWIMSVNIYFKLFRQCAIEHLLVLPSRHSFAINMFHSFLGSLNKVRLSSLILKMLLIKLLVTIATMAVPVACFSITWLPTPHVKLKACGPNPAHCIVPSGPHHDVQNIYDPAQITHFWSQPPEDVGRTIVLYAST